MSAQAVIDLANAIKADATLKALCASSQCADVDDQCSVAKEKGFDIHPKDFDQFNNGDLIETDIKTTMLSSDKGDPGMRIKGLRHIKFNPKTLIKL